MKQVVSGIRLLSAGKWFVRWITMVLAITLVGGLCGSLIYPLAGSLLGMHLGIGEMSGNGLRDGSFYAFIWAPGLAFVLCLIWRQRKLTENQTD